MHVFGRGGSRECDLLKCVILLACMCVYMCACTLFVITRTSAHGSV